MYMYQKLLIKSFESVSETLQSEKPYWSNLGDLALVLPLKLVYLLREKPRLGA